MTIAALNQPLQARRPVTMRDLPALERLLAALAKQRDKPFSADRFNQCEAELGERLRELGREALAQELKKADVDADSVLIDGVLHRRVLRGTETYMTTMGPVEVERTLYKDRTDPGALAVAALEKRLGVVAGFWSPHAAKQVTWVVLQMPPRLAQELFER